MKFTSKENMNQIARQFPRFFHSNSINATCHHFVSFHERHYSVGDIFKGSVFKMQSLENISHSSATPSCCKTFSRAEDILLGRKQLDKTVFKCMNGCFDFLKLVMGKLTHPVDRIWLSCHKYWAKSSQRECISILKSYGSCSIFLF